MYVGDASLSISTHGKRKFHGQPCGHTVWTYSEKHYQHTVHVRVVTSLQTSYYKSVRKLSASTFTLLVPMLLEQVSNKLLTTCYKLDGIINYQSCCKVFQQV